MPCRGTEPFKRRGIQVNDLLELHGFPAKSKFYPETKAELVAAIAASGQEGHSLRALGTNWSLSEAAVAQSVVSTWKLDKHLSQPFPSGGLAPGRLRDGGSNFLREVCAGDRRAAGRQFVHVEAGVKIRTLLSDLKSCGLSLPTMGNGAGQSLAGALSTSTHGADFHTRPLVEWISGVHLVGPGGQEWWITPESSLFANEAVLKLQDWCDDADIVANDDAFNAVRVAVGRMGVIYSMILEVERAYNLIEVNLEHAWSEIRPELEASVAGVKAKTDTSIFDAPLTGLESGWFRSQVLSRTEESLFHPLHYKPGPGGRPVPPPSPSLNKRYGEILQNLRLADLARGLRGAPKFSLRHINIAVNLARPTQCWARRMWRPPDGIHIPPVPPPPEKPNFVKEAVTRHKKDPEAMLDALFEGLSKESFWALLASKVGRLYLERGARRIASQSKAAGATSGEALFLMLYKLATDATIGSFAKPHLIDAVSNLIGGGFSDLALAGLATSLLDKHDYKLDGAQSGNSAEFFFDASSKEYLGFIDEVISLVQRHSPVFGYMGIRFTPRATALIAMQRFPMTVSVEVATARSRLEDVYRGFWTQLHQAANRRRAIPHWGQEFRQRDSDIEAHYGQDLLKWRRMLAELSIDGPSTFSTTFSQKTGLEPKGVPSTGIFDSHSIDQFLAGLSAGIE